jgi:hypothetical protein
MKIVMKRIFLLLMFMMGIPHGQANTNNHYLTFELMDGTKVSVLVSSDISLSFNGTTLFVCKESFSLVNLKRMYFSSSDDTTTGILVPNMVRSEEVEAIFDLKGQKVSRDQMRRGVYIVKSKNGTFKIYVQ